MGFHILSINFCLNRRTMSISKKKCVSIVKDFDFICRLQKESSNFEVLRGRKDNPNFKSHIIQRNSHVPNKWSQLHKGIPLTPTCGVHWSVRHPRRGYEFYRAPILLPKPKAIAQNVLPTPRAKGPPAPATPAL